MTPLITILTITFADVTMRVPYPDEMSCGHKLAEVHELMQDYQNAYGGYIMSQCIRTGAPSVATVRPAARSEQ